MDAMIFAAGLGTRLRPLTDHLPKALIDVGGRPIIDHVAERLVAAGADRLIMNTHAFPELIARHVQQRNGYGVDVRFSHEPDAPLDTGAGLRQAAQYFSGDAPFFLHNCDVISTIDLQRLYRAHGEQPDAIATLAVLAPSANRYLIFDDDGLCGFSPRGGGAEVLVRPSAGAPRRNDFTGIHVASPALLESLPRDGTYSIIDHYLQLARTGVRIVPHEQGGVDWTDIGTHEQLAAARLRPHA